MALIGNPIDFDRIRQRYDSITYPESKKTFGNDVLNMPTLQSGFGNVRTADFRDYNNDGIDDRDQGINIPNPNVKEYFPGTPVPSGLLSNTQSQTIRQDATQPGQQIQYITDPITGRTQIVIPEYMSAYRTDQKDFFPGSSSFESIYSTGDSEIDPTTGRLRETTEEPMPIQTLPNILSGGGDGFNNPYSGNYTGGYMAGNKGYENVDQLMADVKSGFGAFSNPLTNPAFKIAGPPVLSGYKPKIPGLFGNIIETVKEFSLSDLVSNTDKGSGDTKLGPTSTDTDVSGGISDAQKKSGGGGGGGFGGPSGHGSGKQGGKHGGAGGQGGKNKGTSRF
jgi:hypothetical protein